MTESSGLWRCSSLPFTKAGDYDMPDRLIRDMRLRLDAHYRVAYMVGASGTVNNFAGTPLCWYYSGDTVLYNSARLMNLTPADVAGKAQEMHDGPLVGFQVRHSLPICTRGTNLEPMETLIDGVLVADPRCPQSEPSGPAWAQVVKTSNGSHAVVATLARFGFLAYPGSSLRRSHDASDGVRGGSPSEHDRRFHPRCDQPAVPNNRAVLPSGRRR